MTKTQKSLRFEDEAYNGVLRLQKRGETFTAAVNRVLLVGISTLEAESQAKYNVTQNEVQTTPDESQSKYNDIHAERYIKRLEDENARLIAEHEKDREAIAEKDKQIAEALSKSHELALQSNYLARISQEGKSLPATTTGEEITVVMEDEEITQETTETPAKVETAAPVEQPKKRGFWARLWE